MPAAVYDEMCVPVPAAMPDEMCVPSAGCSLDLLWVFLLGVIGFPLGAPLVVQCECWFWRMAPLTLQKRLGIPTADGIFWIDGRANARRRMGMHVRMMSFSCKK